MQINLLYQQAIQLMQRNELKESEKLLNQILKINRNIPEVHGLLGVICGMQNQHHDAIKHFKNAIKMNPSEVSFYVNLGNAYDETSNFIESIKCYKKAISLGGTNHIVWLGLGKAYFNIGNYQLAINALEESIKLNSLDPRAWHNLGLCFFRLANYKEAISQFNNELKIAEDESIYISIGDCEYALGNSNDALAYYDKAISLNPKSFEAYNSKAVIYRQLVKLEEAYESSTKSLDIQPFNIKGLMNLGLVLKTFRRYRDAINVFNEILKIKSNEVDALFNKASCLECIDKYEETLKTFEKLHAINPYHDYLSGSYVNAQLRTYSWNYWDKNKAYLREVVKKDISTSSPFLYLAVSDVQTQYIAAIKYVSQEFVKETENVCNWRASNRKLRIGYFSADFKQHAVSLLTVELFELHDREQFEVIGFSFQNAAKDDEVGKRVKSAFDQFIDLEGVPFEKALTTIRECEVDIAIDLGGHTEGSPLGYFNRYVAPIQISYIGHPGTTGADFIHYTIADENLIPEQYQQYYSEKIIYMPDCFQVNDSKRMIPTNQFTRADCGLPEDKFIFCCFNNSYKINPMIFDVWMRILSKVPNSVLWLLATEPFSEKNLIKEVQKRKIDLSRIYFGQRVKYEQYLSRFKVADLFLDTLPFNAGTTASDALWAGLPVLTCLGDSYAGRMASSLLNAIGIPELITSNLVEYEQLAIDLGNHPEKIKALKIKLEENRFTTPLFNSKLFTKNLERSYLKIYDDYLNNKPKNHIYIK